MTASITSTAGWTMGRAGRRLTAGWVPIQHGLLAARLERLDDRLIAAGVGLVTLFAGDLAIGFAVGAAAVAARAL